MLADDAHERLAEVVVAHADGAQEGAVRRAVQAFGDQARAQFGLGVGHVISRQLWIRVASARRPMKPAAPVLTVRGAGAMPDSVHEAPAWAERSALRHHATHDAPLHPRPRPHRRRQRRHAGAATQPGSGAARRNLGLSALLGRRTPQHGRRREFGHRCAGGPHRRRHEDHPRRLGRRDAAQPCATRDRRAVRHARDALPGPHRPGPGPRPGHRPDDDARAAAQPERQRRRRISARRARTAGLSGRRRHRSSRCARFPASARRCRSGCSAPACTARSSRRIWVCHSRSPRTSRPTCCCRRSTSIAPATSRPRAGRIRTPWSASTWSAPTPTTQRRGTSR